MKENKAKQSSLDKAIDVLDLLAREDNQTIRDIGDALGFSKTTVHRILQTLEQRGLVNKNELERYKLGYGLLELSQRLKVQDAVRDLSLSSMENLSKETGDTVQLAVLNQHNEIVVIESIEGTNNLRVFANPGQTYPITYGNFGKVFLADLSEEKIKEHLTRTPLKKYGNASIMEEEAYLEKIKEVRRNKMSISYDDPIDGAVSIAVPIKNTFNETVAAIAIAGVKTKDKIDHIDQFMKAIKKAAENISEQIKG